MDGNQFWCLSFNVMTTSFMKGQKPCVNGLGLHLSKAFHFISKGMNEGHRGQSSCSLNQVSYKCFSKSCMLPAQSAERKDSFLRVRNFLQNCHFFLVKGAILWRDPFLPRLQKQSVLSSSDLYNSLVSYTRQDSLAQKDTQGPLRCSLVSLGWQRWGRANSPRFFKLSAFRDRLDGVWSSLS